MASAPVAMLRLWAGPASSAGRRFSHGEILWLAFVIVQALDGAMSYVGVSMHGPVIEANPLVGVVSRGLGPAAGFAAAKLFAVTCGAVLYMTAPPHMGGGSHPRVYRFCGRPLGAPAVSGV